MTQETKSTWLQHMGAIGRDVLTISAVISLVFTIGAWSTRTYWEPILALPREVAEIQATIARVSKPALLEFQGRGQVVSVEKSSSGGVGVTLLYSLRRVASCDTEIRPFFYDVERGLTVAGDAIPAVKAPVTADYIPFRITVYVPDEIPPGRYVYYPEVVPKNCGIYGPLRVPPTDVFEVTE